jgi:hypothetical protein
MAIPFTYTYDQQISPAPAPTVPPQGGGAIPPPAVAPPAQAQPGGAEPDWHSQVMQLLNYLGVRAPTVDWANLAAPGGWEAMMTANGLNPASASPEHAFGSGALPWAQGSNAAPGPAAAAQAPQPAVMNQAPAVPFAHVQAGALQDPRRGGGRFGGFAGHGVGGPIAAAAGPAASTVTPATQALVSFLGRGRR